LPSRVKGGIRGRCAQTPRVGRTAGVWWVRDLAPRRAGVGAEFVEKKLCEAAAAPHRERGGGVRGPGDQRRLDGPVEREVGDRLREAVVGLAVLSWSGRRECAYPIASSRRAHASSQRRQVSAQIRQCS
jgi:hypothetical protein